MRSLMERLLIEVENYYSLNMRPLEDLQIKPVIFFLLM
nr:MAG TPA: hypothetical protein [Bacteriophage sp.]